jgi:hypothetical protein
LILENAGGTALWNADEAYLLSASILSATA